MRILVLGAAAGGGFPQWNCNCDNCRLARSGDSRACAQTQSSIAVCVDGERWVLLNASPDLRQQIFQNPPLHPRRGLRHSPISTVVLTNADVDHVGGLLNLRERQSFSLYATARVHEALRGNPIFDVLNGEVVERRELCPDGALSLADGEGRPTEIEVEMFTVPGKVALWLENEAAGPNFGTQAEDTVGLKLTSERDGAHFYYIPGCARMTPDLAQRLDGAPCVLFDGTLWTDDEMIIAGVGAKTGRRMGHMSISGPEGSLSAFAKLGIGRLIFIHLNNTNPVLLDDSPERAAVEAAGWTVARDGMDIEL